MLHSENVNRASPSVAWISSMTSGTDAHHASGFRVEVTRHARYTTLTTRARTAIARMVDRRTLDSGAGRAGAGTGARSQPKASPRNRVVGMPRLSVVVRRRATNRKDYRV